MLAAARTIPLCVPLLLALTCATTLPNPNAAKYPPRGLGCKVRVFHEGAPGVKEWDDLGMARVECPLDVGAVQCLKRLREAVCRMGGDIVYDVPKKPSRPSEEAMIYAGHAAHTKSTPEQADKEDEADAGTADQGPTSETSAPVQPIAPPGAMAAGDGGVPDGGR
jgi:hypothetical protein